jgi:molybdopterin converting factor small subunit|tara:strand:+ start:2694 stop:2984 length:291 start_codon:yes stop_codon:yes gene_type:complete
MKAKILYLGLMRDLVKKREEVLSFDVAWTIRDLVRALVKEYGKTLEDSITTLDGDLRADVLFLVDGQNINHKQGLDTPVRSRDEVTVALLNMAEGG